MPDPVERLVNLAFYLAEAREPVSAERIRVDVAGYPKARHTETFLRMFERDKETLRAAGLAIVTDTDGAYLLDRAATFATSIELSGDEAAAVRAAGGALLGDSSFPFSDDLRLALAKVASALDTGHVASAARLADEDPERQGVAVAELADAARRRKTVAFSYTNSRGVTAPHVVEPYGLFLFDGRWYAVARDTGVGEERTYTVARMSDIHVNSARPKSSDFEPPADFDVASFTRLAFQYGPADSEFEATIRFEPEAAWRADALARGHGALERSADGGVLWHISARDPSRLMRFVLENGPGLVLVAPSGCAVDIATGLVEVVRLHG